MRVPSVTGNIVANALGRVVTAVVSLAFVPVYLRFVGVASYGLIGFFTVLLSMATVLDLGLSTTLNRQLARWSAENRPAGESRDLVRTLEVLYWAVAALLGMLVFLLAPAISRNWVSAAGLSSRTIEQAIGLMGIALALQWPVALYSGGLFGLQRHLVLNLIRAGMAVFHACGAVLVLWAISPTVQAYFAWLCLSSLIQTALIAFALWRSLPPSDARARFRIEQCRANWHFAAGMTGISALAVILTQVDKLVVSRLLGLETFGYYALAAGVAAALGHLVAPIFAALFPRFSQLVAQGDEPELRRLYHEGCQLVALVVIPGWMTVAFFSSELLTLWLRDAGAAAQTHALVTLLVSGTALNALVLLPFGLQLAHGWTRLALVKNIIAVALVVPLILWLTRELGAAGAALTWVILNAAYVAFEIPYMHQRLLRGEMGRWYARDVGVPVVTVALIGLIARTLAPASLSSYLMLLWIVASFAVMMAAAAAVLPATRVWLARSGIITLSNAGVVT